MAGHLPSLHIPNDIKTYGGKGDDESDDSNIDLREFIVILFYLCLFEVYILNRAIRILFNSRENGHKHIFRKRVKLTPLLNIPMEDSLKLRYF